MSKNYDIDHEAEYTKRILPALIEALEHAKVYMGDDATDDSPEARETRRVIVAALKLAVQS